MRKPRLTYANITSTIALFLALSGGVVYAAGKIGTDDLEARAVTSKKIDPKAVKTNKIALDAVDASRLADGSVGTDALLDEAVTRSKLAQDSVTSDRIASDAVGVRELAYPVGSKAVISGGSQAVSGGVVDEPYPLSGDTPWTQAAGEVNLLIGEVNADLPSGCFVGVSLQLSGEPLEGQFVSQADPTAHFTTSIIDPDAASARTLTASYDTSSPGGCTSGTIESAKFRVIGLGG